MNIDHILKEVSLDIEKFNIVVKNTHSKDVNLSALATKLNKNNETLTQLAGESLTPAQTKLADNLLTNIKSITNEKPSRQTTELAGIQQVLMAFREIHSTIEQMKSETEENKRKVTGSRSTDL